MSEYSEVIKGIGQVATSGLVKPLFDMWLKPSLKTFFDKKRLDDALIEHYFENKFSKYMATALEANSYLNTIVFPNQQVKLLDLYLPLTLETNAQGKTEEYLVNQFPVEFLSIKKVLLVDTAGMGKSTLLKYLFLASIEGNVGIPVFLELRRLSSLSRIYDEVLKELTSLEDKVDKSFIDQLISRGDFIFFLDGLDEIPSNEKEQVLMDLNSFIKKAGNNTFLITSRPETALTSLGSFQQFNIKPLYKEEAYKLITTYDGDNKLSKILIEKLEVDQQADNLTQFLTNPLMVSLLYKAYAHKQMLPFKKHAFYRQVYDALFEEHDLTKMTAFVREKKCGLDSDAFHAVLRQFGYDTIKLGKVEYDKDELVYLINRAKANYPKADFSTTKFIEDLKTTVPLFAHEGIYYRWAHKSIQEYFAACFIFCDSKEQQESILLKMFEKPMTYSNVLDIYCDLDYKTFRNSIVKRCAEEYLNYCDSLSYKESDIDIDSVRLRQALLYETDVILTGDFEDGESLLDCFQSILETHLDYEPVANGFYAVELCFIHAYKPKALITELLYNKGEDLFYEIYQLPVYKMSSRSLMNKLKIDYNIRVTDDPKLPINRKKYYDLFNKILAARQSRYGILNYDKCKSMLDQILKDNRRKVDNSLLDGL